MGDDSSGGGTGPLSGIHSPPSPSSPSFRAPGRPALLLSGFLLLLLAASCTFERRPQTQVNADAGVVDTAATAESASTFLRRFQAARTGRPGALEGLVRPGASVLLDGRALALDVGAVAEGAADGGDAPGDDRGGGAATGAGAWEILVQAPPGSGDRIQITDSAVFEGSALFVMGYDGVSETVLLDRDATGWGLQLLHRITVAGGGPGDP